MRPVGVGPYEFQNGRNAENEPENVEIEIERVHADNEENSERHKVYG